MKSIVRGEKECKKDSLLQRESFWINYYYNRCCSLYNNVDNLNYKKIAYRRMARFLVKHNPRSSYIINTFLKENMFVFPFKKFNFNNVDFNSRYIEVLQSIKHNTIKIYII